MAEIKINCPNCNKGHSFSDDATLAALRCMHCGCPLTAQFDQPAGTGAAPPARPAPQVHLTLAGATLAAPPSGGAKDVREKTGSGGNSALGRKGSERRYAPSYSTWMGWILLPVIVAAMVGFQFYATELRDYVPFYIAARNALFALVGLLVIHDAWQDSLSQGLLCLLIPPYLLLYGIASLESNIVRALFFGLVAGVGAEAWLLPQHSLIMALGPSLHELVDSVNGAIQSKKI